MLLLRGDSGDTLTSQSTKTWLEACGAKHQRGEKKYAKVKLFVSDRPFNVLKKDQVPLSFDNITQAQVDCITAAEKELAHTSCRFLSRVSNKTDNMWRTSYASHRLAEQQDFVVVRDSQTCRGPSFKRSVSSGCYRYVH